MVGTGMQHVPLSAIKALDYLHSCTSWSLPLVTPKVLIIWYSGASCSWCPSLILCFCLRNCSWNGFFFSNFWNTWISTSQYRRTIAAFTTPMILGIQTRHLYALRRRSAVENSKGSLLHIPNQYYFSAWRRKFPRVSEALSILRSAYGDITLCIKSHWDPIPRDHIINHVTIHTSWVLIEKYSRWLGKFPIVTGKRRLSWNV